MVNGGLKITIYDDTGKSIITNNLSTPDGTIVTPDMEKDVPKVKTTYKEILSTDYDIIDFNMELFNDSLYELSSMKKIKECQKRLEFYTLGLKNAKTYREISGNNNAYKDIIEKYPDLILKYTQFIEDLKTFGNYRPVLTLESVGEQDILEEEVDLNKLDVNSAPGMQISSKITDAVSSYLETTIQTLIANGTANVLTSMGINEENLDIAHTILDLMDSNVTAINNIMSFIPKNIHMSPFPKTALNPITTSLRDMFMAMYTSVYNKYLETVNDAIINVPLDIESLKKSLDVLLLLMSSLLDEQCIRYTGYTLVELYFMCSDYIAKYNAWKKAKTEQKKQKDKEEEDNNIKTESETTTNRKISIHTDPDLIKASLLDELSKSSDLIYNAFFIIQIKETITQIQDLLSHFQDIDLNVLSDNIDSFDDFMLLLDELGLNEDSAIITLEDSIRLGINQLSNNLNGLQDQLAISALSIINNTNISIDNNTVQLFDFTNDLNNNVITLNIYADPTTKNIKDKITKTLRNAKNSLDINIFDATDVISILNIINKGYELKKDQETELAEFKFKIHFEIEGFNKPPKTFNETITELAEQIEKENLRIQKEREQEALGIFEIGVVTEDYTDDPTRTAKRPTFLLIHELFGILKEIFPLLNILLTLIRNYKINKDKVAKHNKGNLDYLTSLLARLNNLMKTVDKSNKNFYTVRTLKLYDYINNSITPIGNNPEILLNTEYTMKLYYYLLNNNYNVSSLNKNVDTILYIDFDSINKLKQSMEDLLNALNNFFGEDSSLFIQYPEYPNNDGSLDGLDKIMSTDDTIYYSDSSLPLYGSLIMRCFSSNLDVSI